MLLLAIVMVQNLVLFYQVPDIIEHIEHYRLARLEPCLKSIENNNVNFN
jgi:hypothetical protein